MLKPSAIVELIWQDASGSRATTTMFAASGLSAPVIAANVETLAAIIAPLTGCVLVGERIKYKSAIVAGVEPDGAALITHAGVLFFVIDGDVSGGLLVIPAIVDAAFVDDGPGAGAVIDLTNVDISTLVAAVLDAGLCNPFGVPFLDVVGGYLQSRV